jgi:hypothetical protein
MIERSARPLHFSGAFVLAASSVVVSVFAASPVFAKRDGVPASSCNGCHSSAQEAQIEATAQPASFGPGDDVTITLGVSFAGSNVAGVFIAEPGFGQLRATDAELKAVAGGLVHSAPKNAANGQTSFTFAWRAPATPGAVHFEVAALSGNGDGRSSGDATISGVISFVYGCSPETFFRDLDGDGIGSERARPIVDCAGMPPSGFSTRKDDCDDTYERVFPGATEICNQRDDDCDSVVDEGAAPVELWPDEDGDGYYSLRTGTSMRGCVPLAGYAADPGDCAPRDAMRHPGVTEVCNLLDDNCDGRVDERVRPQCGVGLCLSNSATCDAEDCRPGEPEPEICNLLDDDCNGFVDDGMPCAEGRTCVDGSCVIGGTPSPSGGSATGGSAGGSTSVSSAGLGSRGGEIGGTSPAAGGQSSSGAPRPANGGSRTTPAPNAGAAPGRGPSGCGTVGAGTSVLGWVFLALLGAARARRRL